MITYIPYSGTAYAQVWVRGLSPPNQAWRKGSLTTSSQSTIVGTYCKESTDTDRFIPNQYRVNPYRVYTKTYSWDDNPFTVQGSNAINEYKVEFTGPWGLGSLRSIVEPSQDILSELNSLDKYVLARALSKVGESEVGLGENLGELKETLNMLRHPLQSLRDFLLGHGEKNLDKYRKVVEYTRSGVFSMNDGRLLRGKKAVEAATDTWLELRYGIMPLIYTASDLMEAVRKARLFNPERILHSRSRLTYERIPSCYKRDDLGLITPCYVERQISAVSTDTVSCNASVDYRRKEQQGFLEKYGLSPYHLPELVWELTRASFVVDWWLDVGTFLGMLRSTPGIEILGNTVGIRISRKVNVGTSYWLSPQLGVGPIVAQANQGSLTFDYYRRDVNVTAAPRPYFRPDFQSLTHLVDALALITQPLLRKFKA